MTPLPDPFLLNQSVVRFTSGSQSSIAYSNIVSIPLYGPAIAIVKQTDSARAEPGSTLTYRLRVTNGGNAAAFVTLFDPYPAETSLIANSVLRDGAPLPGADPASGIPLGSLAPGGEVAVSFQLILTAIPASLKITNEAHAIFIFKTPEGRVSEGEATSNAVTIPVSAVKLSAKLGTRWSQTFAGDVVRYEIVVSNEGGQLVSGVSVVVSLSAGLTFLSGSVTVDDVRSPDAIPVEEIAVGNIPAGASVYIAFDAQVGDLPDGSVLTSDAIVYYASGGEPLSADTNAVSIVVVRPVVLLTLSVSPGLVAPGDTVSYTAIVHNASGIAVDAQLLDFLPAGLTLVGGSVAFDGQRVAGVSAQTGIPLGIVGPGARVFVAFQALAADLTGAEAPPIYTSRARLIYAFRLNDGRAVRAATASNSVTVRVVSPVLDLAVFAEPAHVFPGEEIAIRAEVSNAGNAAAETTLTSLIPPGTRLAGYSVRVDGMPTALSVDGSLALGWLAPGDRRTVAYRIAVPELTDDESINGSLTAQYRFEVSGRPYSGASRSNTYQVQVLGHEE